MSRQTRTQPWGGKDEIPTHSDPSQHLFDRVQSETGHHSYFGLDQLRLFHGLASSGVDVNSALYIYIKGGMRLICRPNLF